MLRFKELPNRLVLLSLNFNSIFEPSSLLVFFLSSSPILSPLSNFLSLTFHEFSSPDGVLKRDPRMVERKKTGLAKARKAYT